MYRLHQLISGRRDDREAGFEVAVSRILLPYARKSKKLAIFSNNAKRNLCAVCESFPFVKAVCGDKAAAFSKITSLRCSSSSRKNGSYGGLPQDHERRRVQAHCSPNASSD